MDWKSWETKYQRKFGDEVWRLKLALRPPLQLLQSRPVRMYSPLFFPTPLACTFHRGLAPLNEIAAVAPSKRRRGSANVYPLAKGSNVLHKWTTLACACAELQKGRGTH